MDSNFEIRTVTIKYDSGDTLLAELRLFEESPRNSENVQIDMHLNQEVRSFVSTNFFYALLDLRKYLELSKLQICCNGAARNVYPSPMCLGMGTGRKAYKLELGKQARMINLIDIFDCEEDLVFTYIEEQRLFYESWLNSLK